MCGGLIFETRQESGLTSLDLFHDEGFENIAFLDVVEAFQTDTAFVALNDFLCVILEALEGGDLIFEDHDTVTDDTDLGLTCDLTVKDIGTGNRTDIRNVLP